MVLSLDGDAIAEITGSAEPSLFPLATRTTERSGGYRAAGSPPTQRGGANETSSVCRLVPARPGADLTARRLWRRDGGIRRRNAGYVAQLPARRFEPALRAGDERRADDLRPLRLHRQPHRRLGHLRDRRPAPRRDAVSASPPGHPDRGRGVTPRRGSPIPQVSEPSRGVTPCPHPHPGILIADVADPANPTVVGEI